ILLVSHDRDFLDRVATSTLASEGNGVWVEYAGGYSDMLAQRGEAKAKPEASKPEAGKPKTSARPAALPQTAAPVKLSFKEQHELKTLTAKIETLHAEVKKFEAVLAEPGLYNKDIKKFKAATNGLADAQDALAKAEERWLELEVIREAS
ncbi:MAG TPA: ABC transporter ATP-binding protein, partial [Acidocella sp.]|nr:ABC transporter ATP-binding protein [Acidocella sp.]